MNRLFLLCVLCLLLFVPCLSAADIPVRVSILSILRPQEVTLTLQHPDRAMLQSAGWNRPIESGKPFHVQLRNQRLLIGSEPQTHSVSVVCSKPCEVQINIPGKIIRKYRGDLELTAGPSAINIILQLSQEELIASIVTSEMGEHRSQDVLRAFAIVARSFLESGPRHPEIGADVCDLTHCQVFQGYKPSREAEEAVQKTQGLILTFQGKQFRTYYSRSCGGTTATYQEVWNREPEIYPFPSVKCPCNEKWDTTLSMPEINLLSGSADTRIQTEEAGIVLVSGTKQIHYTMETFRILAGRHLGWNRIRSNSFVLEPGNHPTQISGKGIGHRLGFCQTGSALLAKQGKSFNEILQYYFPNTEIKLR